MISKGRPVAPSQQGVLFYVYCDDVAALREELVRAGVDAGPIRTPFYAPRGEFEIRDVPAGSHPIRVWHEQYGELTQTVRVAAGATATVDFNYPPK